MIDLSRNYPLSFNIPPPTEIYPLSLHDALPILRTGAIPSYLRTRHQDSIPNREAGDNSRDTGRWQVQPRAERPVRSEEHTSELQSLRHLVCRLLLEKKKKLPTRVNRDKTVPTEF